MLETTYPTTYGCYRGRTWSRAELICQSDVSTHGPFADYAAALREAKRVRSYECRFEDFESIDEDMFDEEPPWDSAELGNYDNDEEVLIEIRTRKEHEATCAEEQKLVAKARGKQIYGRRLEEQMLRRQVEAAGRVHYSRPPQPWEFGGGAHSGQNGKEDRSDGSLSHTPLADLDAKGNSANGGDERPDLCVEVCIGAQYPR